MTELLLKISRRQAFVYAGFLVLYEFLTYIANDMIMPGMLKVIETFHAQEAVVASSLTLYVLGGASLQIFLGPLSDYYGRRPVMIFGAAFFLLCTALIACSNSIETFLVSRFFQGMGLCFINVVGYATLQEIFVEMEAIRLIAVMANIAIIAPLVGPLLGALFIYYYNWRFIFFSTGFFAVIALWGIYKYMPESVARNDENRVPAVHAIRSIFTNYLQLVLNPVFILGSIALGLIYLPCMIWIALSPIMLVKEAHLSLIQYSLWQLPVFGSYILGNIYLQHLTHSETVKSIIRIGSYIVVISLLLVTILSYAMTSHFYALMPGLIVYFFGLSTVSGPLIRLVLFSTSVTKGTASALMSMISMLMQSIGIEVANILYDSTHNNHIFALYCTISGIVYAICIAACFKYTPKNTL